MGRLDWKTYTVEDLAVGMVRFERNMALTVESSFAAHIEKDLSQTQIMGTRGGCVIGDDGLRVFFDLGGKMVNLTRRLSAATTISRSKWRSGLRLFAAPLTRRRARMAWRFSAFWTRSTRALKRAGKSQFPAEHRLQEEASQMARRGCF